MTKNEILLKAKDVSKSFSGVRVLKGVDLDIKKGEVHALMGENGAGKSTLIKILTGTYSKDGGEIYYNGQLVEIKCRKDSMELGIGTIFQELSVVPALSVAENIYLGMEPVNKLGIINKKLMHKKAQELIEKYKFILNADDIVDTLGFAQRQIVEILKALAVDTSMLIMDEPTASLTTTESEHLFDIIRSLAAQGVSIIYISHRMEEVYDLADTITVLRDGINVGSYDKTKIQPSVIVKEMLGKEIAKGDMYAKPTALNANTMPLLEVRELIVPGLIDNINFDLYPGEILAVSGLMGAGRTETLRTIFGTQEGAHCRLKLQDKEIKVKCPSDAIKQGIGFVPEDRRLEGLVPMLSVKQNLLSCNLDWVNKTKLFTDSKKEKQISIDRISGLNVKPKNPEAMSIQLSGGNQQKVVLGKWLSRPLKVLLIDEPTAGVDVGAKSEIYALLEGLLNENFSIILVTSDLEELLKLANRIIVLRKGKIISEMYGGEADAEKILSTASGLNKEAHYGKD